MRQINIDFLFYDDQSCDRCKTTKDFLLSAVEKFEKKHEDIKVKIRRQKLSADEIKKSPTILLDGIDLESYLISQPKQQANYCDDCSCLIGKQVACRTYNNQNYLFEDQILFALEKYLNKRGRVKKNLS